VSPENQEGANNFASCGPIFAVILNSKCKFIIITIIISDLVELDRVATLPLKYLTFFIPTVSGQRTFFCATRNIGLHWYEQLLSPARDSVIAVIFRHPSLGGGQTFNMRVLYTVC